MGVRFLETIHTTISVLSDTLLIHLGSNFLNTFLMNCEISFFPAIH